MELNNEINNNINVEKNNFLNSVLGKTINTAIDIGLRAILPDLIENQVIDIKNALLQNGLKSGIDTAVNSAINLGKSAVGIVTGNFENMELCEKCDEGKHKAQPVGPVFHKGYGQHDDKPCRQYDAENDQPAHAILVFHIHQIFLQFYVLLKC